jgi:CRP-like cAMP-binding protein
MENNLSALFETIKPKRYKQGKVIIYEGDSVDKIYLIKSGYIKVYTEIMRDTQRIVFIYRPGEIFPLTTYLSSDNIARFFYECLTPVQLGSRKFQKKVKNNVDLGEEIIDYTRKIDHQFLQRVNDLVSDEPPRDKAVKTLLFLMKRVGSDQDKNAMDVPLDVNFFAAVCGLAPEEASQQLRLFKEKGVISGTQNIAVDSTRLKKIASKSAKI